MADDEKLPALRPLEITPLPGENSEPYFALYDQARIAPRPLAVSWPGYFVLAHLDGRHSRADILEAFRRQFGQAIAVEQIDGLLATLDEALLLQNERFERAYAARERAYLAGPTRRSREGWPAPDVLRAQIEQMLAGGCAAAAGAVRGIMVPHLDYRRGAPCYADAYSVLFRAAPAARYVILGTNHAGRARSVVATRKDFETPLGRVRTDRAFIERLEERIGSPICKHEFDHQAEHSIELQTHILQVGADPRAFEIVPILCPDPCGPTGLAPADGEGPDLGSFADALAELMAREDRATVVIAAADLSHVGRRFGDPSDTTPEFLEEVARRDRQLLALLEQRREEQFLQAVRAAGNPTRICSVGGIYALLRSLPAVGCRLLSYHQAADFGSETTVSCAALVVG